MFDPDRPQKSWENRSLLSFGTTPEKPDSRGAGATETSLRPHPAADREPEERDETGGSAAADERPGVLRAFFGRKRDRAAVMPQPREDQPESAHPETLRDDGGRSSVPLEEEQDFPARDRSRHSREDLEPVRRAPAEENVYWRPIIDPGRVILGVLGAKRLIVATTVLGALAGILFALATPKQYYSGTEILFDPRDLQIVDRDLTSGSLPSDATLALIENQVAIIRSSVVLNRVVERLGLTGDPEFNGEGGSPLGILLNPRALLSFGDGSSNPGTRLTLTVQNLARKMRVERNERTFIIHIGAITKDPEKSALIANTTAEVYMEQTGEMQQSTANRATTELTERLGELQAAVETAERAVADFKARHDLIDADGRLISDDEMVRLNDQLANVRARTAEIQARVDSARDLDVSQVLGGSLPEQVSSPMMTELLGQHASLKQQADRAASRLGPRHPDNMSVQAELAGAREAIAGELRRVVASMQVELARARQLEQELSGRLAQLKVQKGDVEAQRVELRELEREAAARRAVYESFLLRARQTGQQRSINTANVSVISTAYPPLLPTGASRVTIVMAGAVLGFLAGIGIGGGMGAVESLRENMGGSGRSAPSDARSAALSRRDEGAGTDDGDLDPPPGGGPPRRDSRSDRLERRGDGGARAMRHEGANGRMAVAVQPPLDGHGGPQPQARAARSNAPAAAISPGFYPLVASRRAEELSCKPPSPQRQAEFPDVGAVPATSQGIVTSPRLAGDESISDEDPLSLERLRRSLRAFRREVDELAERRRYG